MEKSEKQPVIIKKASGDEEPYLAEKLKKSLQNAGAGNEIIREVSDDVQSWIYDGVTTNEIYSRAYLLLRQKRNHVAARYKLKTAIMELGPTGFPFEHFIGKIMEIQGFAVEVGQTIAGKCVTHEVDVVATRGKEQYFVECKYGLNSGKTVNVKVPLYIRSRVNDIIAKKHENEEYKNFSFYGWVVTNNRFTTDAIAYGTCSGLHLLSWDYPKENGLKNIIDREKIYPITVLNHLTKIQKQKLMEKGIVVCRQLKENPHLLNQLNINENDLKFLMQELEGIL